VAPLALRTPPGDSSGVQWGLGALGLGTIATSTTTTTTSTIGGGDGGAASAAAPYSACEG